MHNSPQNGNSRKTAAMHGLLVDSMHRAFLNLQNYKVKHELEVQLKPLQSRLSMLTHMRNKDGLVVSVSSSAADHHEMSMEEIVEEIDVLSEKKKLINGKLFEIESRRDSRVSAEDLICLLETLYDYKSEKIREEVERMIFEVDESMDGHVNWDEFQLTYQRNRQDKTGLEPYALHNVISFHMLQAEGKITLSEAKDSLKKNRRFTEDQTRYAMLRVCKLNPDNHGGDGKKENHDDNDHHAGSKPTFGDQQITYAQYKEMASKRYILSGEEKKNEMPKPMKRDGVELTEEEKLARKLRKEELSLPYLRKKGKGLAGVSSVFEVNEVVPEPSRKTLH